jgi:hypothetical protein
LTNIVKLTLHGEPQDNLNRSLMSSTSGKSQPNHLLAEVEGVTLTGFAYLRVKLVCSRYVIHFVTLIIHHHCPLLNLYGVHLRLVGSRQARDVIYKERIKFYVNGESEARRGGNVEGEFL